MENLKIKIQTLEDSEKQPLVMLELEDKKVTCAHEMTVCIMEDMTAGHKAAVCFVLHHPDGTHSSHLLTENLMDGLISCYKGALKRFKDLRTQRLTERN